MRDILPLAHSASKRQSELRRPVLRRRQVLSQKCRDLSQERRLVFLAPETVSRTFQFDKSNVPSGLAQGRIHHLGLGHGNSPISGAVDEQDRCCPTVYIPYR